jgi:hypothetical protein
MRKVDQEVVVQSGCLKGEVLVVRAIVRPDGDGTVGLDGPWIGVQVDDYIERLHQTAVRDIYYIEVVNAGRRHLIPTDHHGALAWFKTWSIQPGVKPGIKA